MYIFTYTHHTPLNITYAYLLKYAFLHLYLEIIYIICILVDYKYIIIMFYYYNLI